MDRSIVLLNDSSKYRFHSKKKNQEWKCENQDWVRNVPLNVSIQIIDIDFYTISKVFKTFP